MASRSASTPVPLVLHADVLDPWSWIAEKRIVIAADELHGRFFPLEHAQRMQEILPRARLELIDDSYTFVSEDQPQQLARLIREFAR